MIRILKTAHKVLITIYLAIVYPIVGLLSLISMAIGFQGFSSIKDWHLIWVDCVKTLWSDGALWRRKI